ncbi:MAG: GAF domain-containing protein [Ruminiclostridium sp.]|nr:GAF domain-containing protein [Ruminiclostridium sp.]
MFHFKNININDKKEFYHQINTCLLSMIQDEPDWLAGLANASALLYQLMPEINWAGFYLDKGEELVLGPFQGKPACIRIAFGRGVCGTAAKTGKIQIVDDVNLFPGHIACDSESQSEIVLPVFQHQRLIGVLDIDSPVKARFDQEDTNGLVQFIDILNQCLKWPENFK